VSRMFDSHYKGGALVFVIALLAVLSLMAAALLFSVRQGTKIATNSLNSVQTDLTTQSGLNVVRSTIHSAVQRRLPYTPEGKFRGNSEEWNVDINLPWQIANDGPLAAFKDDTASEDSFALFDLNDLRRFTSTPLFASNTANSPDAELAIPQLVQANNSSFFKSLDLLDPTGKSKNPDPVPIDNFFAKYPPKGGKDLMPNVKPLQRSSNLRGKFFAWVADLDDRFYINWQNWGIETTGVRPSVFKTPAVISDGIFKTLQNYSTIDSTILSELNAAAFPVLSDPRNPNFARISDFMDPADSLDVRADIERYFSVYLDNGSTKGAVKPQPSAININTAPREIIIAALSQIPAENDGETLGTGIVGDTKAERLADRIIAKRPFLCRLDFEDFLAAHLRGKYDYTTGTVDITDPGQRTLAFPTATEVDSGTVSLIEMIRFAIPRRWMGSASIMTVNKELSLSEYLEIPAASITDPKQFEVKIGGLTLLPNDPACQLARFEYFADIPDALGVSDPRGDASITLKEFNNVLNSISNVPAQNDDVQLLKPYHEYDPSAPEQSSDDVVVIGPGPNGLLDTLTPLGDDILLQHIVPGPTSTTLTNISPFDEEIGGHIYPGSDLELDTPVDTAAGDTLVADKIVVGLDRIASTMILSNRPSYYSYSNDAYYMGADPFVNGFWNNVLDTVDFSINRNDLIDYNGETLSKKDAEEKKAVDYVKFYYRRAPAPSPMDPRPSAKFSDLSAWSCRTKASTLTARRGSYFQLVASDWASDFGPLQPSGDPESSSPESYDSAGANAGLRNDGDVSWSPTFGFHSRYFGIFVVGKTYNQGWLETVNENDPLVMEKAKSQGEKRIEAVYDALLDQIIWQRSPITDKRALGEPAP
jgi:hypothetical protein